ncbi:hypothetical protein SUGI_0245750 [Cryptomeria japonica]|nr:hypothetical protein SUGI_0245750 [Cryptomeria japonica]
MASIKDMLASTSYASVIPRIDVFLDDLDQCQESVIFQVLSAFNLVLAICKISVIVGMDKALIERAIIKKYGDKSLKDSQQLAYHYLQKIIQLTLDLPNPSEDESKRFWDTQLGVFSKPSKNENPEVDAPDGVLAKKVEDYDALFSINDRKFDIHDLADHLMKICSGESTIPDSTMSRETSAATQSKGDSVAIDAMPRANTDSSRKSESALQNIGNAPLKPDAGGADRDGSVDRLGIYLLGMARKQELHHRDNKDEKMPATSDVKDIVGRVQDSENIELNAQDLKEKGVSENAEYPKSSSTKLGSSQTIEGVTKEVSEHSGNKEAAPETFVEGMNLSNISDDPESNKGLQFNDFIKDQMMRETDGEADVSITRDYIESNNKAISQKLDDVVKKVREEVEKALREEIDKTLGKKMDELHKEIKELKEVKQQFGKNKKIEDEKKERLKTWKRMRSALKRYDASMEGIRAFQRFRFYCEAGYLPWPLPNEENEDLGFLHSYKQQDDCLKMVYATIG